MPCAGWRRSRTPAGSARTGFRANSIRYYLAASGWLILAAMVFDALDGYFARLFKSTGRFGAELDSLCDAISFGAAPAFLLLQLGPQLGPAAIAPVDGRRRHAVLDVHDPAAGALQRRIARRRRQRQAISRLAVAGRGRMPRDRWPSSAASWASNWPTLRPAARSFRTGDRGRCSARCFVALLMVSHVAYPHLTKSLLRGRRQPRLRCRSPCCSFSCANSRWCCSSGPMRSSGSAATWLPRRGPPLATTAARRERRHR